MGDSIVQLQERQSFQPISAASNQIISTPIVERESLTSLPASSLDRRNVDLQALSAPVQIEDPINTRPITYDPEKGSFERHSYPTSDSQCNHLRLAHAIPEDDGDDDRPKEHAIWILIYLSALSPILSLPVALYTLLMGTLLLLLFPLCFYLKRLRFCTRFRRLLSPLLVFQLRLIYSSYEADDRIQIATDGITMLVLVSLLSPLYAVAIAVAAWVAGAFWSYTAILGNPDGKEERDDGREAVLAVRGWWEKWLIRSLEAEDHSTFGASGSEYGPQEPRRRKESAMSLRECRAVLR